VLFNFYYGNISSQLLDDYCSVIYLAVNVHNKFGFDSSAYLKSPCGENPAFNVFYLSRY